VRQVEDDVARWELEARVRERCAHTHAALPHGGLGEPHEVEAGQALAEVDLDVDGLRVDA
jgi:hypothetical protein